MVFTYLQVFLEFLLSELIAEWLVYISTFQFWLTWKIVRVCLSMSAFPAARWSYSLCVCVCMGVCVFGLCKQDTVKLSMMVTPFELHTSHRFDWVQPLYGPYIQEYNHTVFGVTSTCIEEKYSWHFSDSKNFDGGFSFWSFNRGLSNLADWYPHWLSECYICRPISVTMILKVTVALEMWMLLLTGSCPV